MERVIVSVRRSGETRFRDLDLPAEVPVSELANQIAEALQWGLPSPGSAYHVCTLPQRTDLSPHATLLSAMVRPGSALEFSFSAQPVRANVPPPAGQNAPAPEPAGVVKGWIPLFDPGSGPVPAPSGPAPAPSGTAPNQPPDDPSPNQGYTWKVIS